MISVRAKVSETGELSLPAEFRRAAGLERGGEVVIELHGSEKPTVDEFLAERRKEAERE